MRDELDGRTRQTMGLYILYYIMESLELQATRIVVKRGKISLSGLAIVELQYVQIV